MFKVYVDGQKVQQTDKRAEAHEVFQAHKDMADEGFGGMIGKQVTLYKQDEVIETYKPY